MPVVLADPDSAGGRGAPRGGARTRRRERAAWPAGRWASRPPVADRSRSALSHDDAVPRGTADDRRPSGSDSVHDHAASAGETVRWRRRPRASAWPGRGTAGVPEPSRRTAACRARPPPPRRVVHQRLAHDPARVVLARVELAPVDVVELRTHLVLELRSGRRRRWSRTWRTMLAGLPAYSGSRSGPSTRSRRRRARSAPSRSRPACRHLPRPLSSTLDADLQRHGDIHGLAATLDLHLDGVADVSGPDRHDQRVGVRRPSCPSNSTMTSPSLRPAWSAGRCRPGRHRAGELGALAGEARGRRATPMRGVVGLAGGDQLLRGRATPGRSGSRTRRRCCRRSPTSTRGCGRSPS